MTTSFLASLSLTGKTALVAGSTQGIGLAIAQALASLGCTCVLISRNEASLRKAVATLATENGQRHSYLQADFSQPEDVRTTVAAFLETGGQLEILVNNTGGPPAGPLTSATPEAFLAAFHQHLICNHLLATLLTPGMKSAGYGRIINVISTSVKVPLKGLGVSNTIRGAVASWAKTLSVELAADGITVNNVLPGATATARLEAIVQSKMQKSGNEEEKVTQEMLSEIPAGRFGQPEEIAALAAFLASPAAGYINGTSIPVDGGRTGAF